MAEFLKPATVKAIAAEFYGYKISDEAAERVAGAAGALLSNSRALQALSLDEVEPPFGYANLTSEATRLRR